MVWHVPPAGTPTPTYAPPSHHTHTHANNQPKQPYYRKKDFSAKALVSEDLMREGVRNLTQVVDMAKKVCVALCARAHVAAAAAAVR